jgi:heat shock protein HslJ
MDPTTRSITAVLTLLVLALAGCGEATEAEDDRGVAADDSSGRTIADGDYVSAEITGHDLVPGSEIRLGWHDGRLALNAGCNSMSGPAAVEDDELRVRDLAGTEMGCAPALMDQDAWLVDFVTAGPKVSVDGDAFTLSSTTAEIRFTPEPEPEDQPLEGTTWELESTQEGDVASSGPLGPDTPVTDGGPRRPELRIAQGTLSAFDGCNQLRGPVEITGGTLRTDELLGTKRACVDPTATRTARLLGELLQESSYAVDGDRLTLRRDDVAMVFRAR